MGEDTSSPTSVDEDRIAERVRVLVERGLDRYGRGDLRGALAEWEHALALDPTSDRAREYVDYVRANFDVLQATFDQAKEVARLAAELDVPFGLETVREQDDDDDDSDYASLEVEIGAEEAGELDEVAEGSGEDSATAAGDQEQASAAARADDARSAARAIDSVDEGWFLDDYADALPPPPETAAAPGQNLADELDAVPTGILAIGPEAEAAPEGSAGGAAAGDATAPAQDDEQGRGDAAGGDSADAASEADAEDSGTSERESPEDAPGPAARAKPGAEFEDDAQTVERSVSAPGSSAPSVASLDADAQLGEDEEITVPGGEEPPPFSAKVSFSQDALAALGPDDVERGAPPEETTAERPGIVNRRLNLTGLEELDSGMRQDDRVLDDEESAASPQVTFRVERAGRHAWAGSLSHEPDDIEEEEKTIERGASVLTDMDDELTVERRSDHLPTPAVIVDESLMTDELPTVEQPLPEPAPRNRQSPVAGAQDFAEGDAEQLTRERPRDVGATSAERALPGGEGDSVAGFVDRILSRLDIDAPADESLEDHARRRVTALLQHAREEADAGNRARAVALLDFAMEEEPDSAAAQMVIHRHRDMLYDIYSGYIGDMNGVPGLARPLDDLSADELDNRAVFLLSRVDGTLSFEEVLDVAGMPRLEAYRVLCRMLLQGVLEVR